MLRFIRSLRERDLLAPAGFVLAFLLILSLIIVLGQFFHRTLQDEMANQFNAQQLLLAQQVAVNVEGFINGVFKDISVIARHPDIERIAAAPGVRSIVQGIHFHLASDIVLTIQVLDRSGTVRYDSGAPGREGGDLSRSVHFRAARALRRGELYVSDLFDAPDRRFGAKQLIVATPIRRGSPGSPAAEFGGMVQAVLSLDGITAKFLAQIRSGTRGYAWMMDDAGTLLYHPTQPQMVGKNLHVTDQGCFKCHRSFDTEKRMIEGRTETFGSYEAPGGENKVAAFFRVPVGARTWIVVVSAPYTDVIALMHKSRMFYSFLIISIFLTTLAASTVMIVIYKKKVLAEERALHLENQRRLEQEVVLTKNYLENIIENTKTSLMVLDRDLAVKTVNTAQARTLNRAAKEILGRPFFSLFPDGLRPYNGIPIESLLQKALSGGRSFEIKEYRITGIQAEPVYLDMIVSPLLIAGGVEGIVITSSNATKRVLLEEALKKYTEELEVRVEREVAEHRKLEQQVLHSEKLAALGRLAAGIAHEIGNPLTSISTFAQMLREMAADEFTQSSLDIINTHIQRITEIVRQMSSFSRPAAMNLRPHQVNDILRASLDLMRLDKRMKSTIVIKENLSPDIPRTVIDEGQVAQVFINIILNALDAMPEGGTLTVSSRRLADEQGRDSIEIGIADTGVGLPASEFERIFDPFYTTKEAGKGTGLGLSVSYDIIKRFGGDIKVASEPGEGTIFTVILPVQPEPSKEPQHA